MITWTTYGSWLQGEKKGYVKHGVTYKENIILKQDCERKMKGKPVQLRQNEKEIVRQTILESAKRFNQEILAVSVYSDHVHIVCTYVDVPIHIIAGYYKNACRVALQKNGLAGRIWTAGYYKSFCFDEKSLQNRIKYVTGH